MSDSDEKPDLEEARSILERVFGKKIKATTPEPSQKPPVARRVPKTPPMTPVVRAPQPRPKEPTPTISYSEAHAHEIVPEPKRYPGTIRWLLFGVACVMGPIIYLLSHMHLKQDPETSPAPLLVQLTRDCNTALVERRNEVTGLENGVLLNGITTITEFSIEKKGSREVCTNSESLRKTLQGSGKYTTVTNEGENNCINYIEQHTQSVADVFTIDKHGGDYLHVCGFPPKG